MLFKSETIIKCVQLCAVIPKSNASSLLFRFIVKVNDLAKL